MKHTHVKKALVSKDNPCIVNGILPSGVVVQLADCKSFLPREYEQEANAERIANLWNAAKGLSNEEAVKYLKHGREMLAQLKSLAESANRGTIVVDVYCPIEALSETMVKVRDLIEKLEGVI